MESFSQNYNGGVSVPDSLTHILLESCTFQNNASHNGSLIKVSFGNMIQNIEFKTCAFTSNISLVEPLLSFAYTGTSINENWILGTTTQTVQYGNK